MIGVLVVLVGGHSILHRVDEVKLRSILTPRHTIGDGHILKEYLRTLILPENVQRRFLQVHLGRYVRSERTVAA